MRNFQRTGPQVNMTAMRSGLALVLLFGAARHDATPKQLDALRGLAEDMKPDADTPLGETKLTDKEVATRLLAIMGEDWTPTGEWAKKIEQFVRVNR